MAHYLNLVRVPLLVLRNSAGRLPRMDLLETDVIECRVLPWDLDFNFHLNNSRYLSYMDYARIRVLARLGLLDNFFSRKHTGLVGSVDVTYRRSLNFAVRFTIHSRIDCWDEKWFYMEQIFYFKQGLATHAWVKMLFRGPEGNIPPQLIADKISPGIISPPLSPRLRQWNAAIRDTLRGKEAKDAR